MEQDDSFSARKRKLGAWYMDALTDCTVVFHQPHGNVFHTHWMCSILVPHPAEREPLRAELAAAGIETRPVFSPVHSMPMYSQRFRKYPVAESLGRRGVNLPRYPETTRKQVRGIATVIFRGK